MIIHGIRFLDVFTLALEDGFLKKYKIKYRHPRYDNIVEHGYYIYSRTFQKNKNGNIPFRRERISGSFETRSAATARADMMALKLNEIQKKVKKRPGVCPKTKKKTSNALCANCARACIHAGRIGRRGKR